MQNVSEKDCMTRCQHLDLSNDPNANFKPIFEAIFPGRSYEEFKMEENDKYMQAKYPKLNIPEMSAFAQQLREMKPALVMERVELEMRTRTKLGLSFSIGEYDTDEVAMLVGWESKHQLNDETEGHLRRLWKLKYERTNFYEFARPSTYTFCTTEAFAELRELEFDLRRTKQKAERGSKKMKESMEVLVL